MVRTATVEAGSSTSVNLPIQVGGVHRAALGAGTGIDRTFIFLMRGTGGLGNIRPATRAWINQLLFLQAAESRFIVREPFCLKVMTGSGQLRCKRRIWKRTDDGVPPNVIETLV